MFILLCLFVDDEHQLLNRRNTNVLFIWLFSSPEPLGSQGELIGWP